MSKYLKIHYFLVLSLSFNSSWAKTADQTLVANAKTNSTRTILPTAPFNNVKENKESDATKKGSFPQQSQKGKPLQPVELSWILVPKSEHGDHGNGNRDGEDKNSDGNGNGNASGNGNGAGNKLEMQDDDAPASAANPSNGNQGDKKGSGGSQGGNGGKIIGSATKPSHWWPMCIFMDQNVKNPEQIIKKAVDQTMDDCNVLIVPFPVKVDWKSVMKGENDYKTVNDLSREKCNLPNGLRGSATALVPYDRTAGAMCGVKKYYEKEKRVDASDDVS